MPVRTGDDETGNRKAETGSGGEMRPQAGPTQLKVERLVPKTLT
jgi:hypothetical protein